MDRKQQIKNELRVIFSAAEPARRPRHDEEIIGLPPAAELRRHAAAHGYSARFAVYLINNFGTYDPCDLGSEDLRRARRFLSGLLSGQREAS